MASQPRAWNGEHNRVPRRDLSLESRASWGPAVWEKAGVWRAPDKQARFRNHSDSSTSLRLGSLAASRKLRNVIAPCRTTYCPWAKTVDSCPLLADFQTSPPQPVEVTGPSQGFQAAVLQRKCISSCSSQAGSPLSLTLPAVPHCLHSAKVECQHFLSIPTVAPPT